MSGQPFKPFNNLKCKGHSTAKWIAEHFPDYQELMSPIMHINPNHLIYPHYGKLQNPGRWNLFISCKTYGREWCTSSFGGERERRAQSIPGANPFVAGRF